MKAKNSSEFQKFDALVRKIIAVPHSEIKERMEKWKTQRKRKKRAKS